MAEETKGITIDLKLQAKNVANQLRSIKKDARNLSAEFREMEKAGKLNPEGIGSYANQLTNLHRQTNVALQSVKKHKEYLELMESQYDKNSNKVKEANHQYEMAKIRLDECVSAEKNARSALFDMNGALEDNTGSVQDNAKAYEHASEKLNAFSVAVGTLAAHAIRDMARYAKQLAQDVYASGTEFEAGVDALAAIYGNGLSGEELESLSGYFRELGENSLYSANEITKNAQVLANAGYTADQTRVSIAAINDLAIGTGESFDNMANVVVDGLHAFRMEAEDARHFADVLAKTAVSSNTNVGLLGEAFKYAGTVAGSFKYDIEDVGLALGIMASNGVKGTQAGTALRNIISRLATDTGDARQAIQEMGFDFYDAEGQARPLVDVLRDLNIHMKELSPEEAALASKAIAGQRGLAALGAIVNMTTEDFDALAATIRDCNGQVEYMSKTRLENVAGSVQLLKNNWEETKLELYEGVAPALKDVADELTKMMKSPAFKLNIKQLANTAGKVIRDIGQALKLLSGNMNQAAGIAKGLFGGSLIFGGAGKTAQMVNNLAVSFGTLQGSSVPLLSSLGSIAGILGPIGTGIQAAGLATSVLYAWSEQSIGAFWDMHPALASVRSDLDMLKDSMDGTNIAVRESIDAANEEYNSTNMLLAELDRYVDANGRIKAGYEERVNYIVGELQNAYGVEISVLDGVIQQYDQVQKSVRELAEEKARAAMEDAFNDQLTESIKNQAAALGDAKVAGQEYITAINDFMANDSWKSVDWSVLGEGWESEFNNFSSLIKQNTEESLAEANTFVQNHRMLWDDAISTANSSLQESYGLYAQALSDGQAAEDALATLRTEGLNAAIEKYASYAAGIAEIDQSSSDAHLALIAQRNALELELQSAQTEAEKTALKAKLAELQAEIDGFNNDPATKTVVGLDVEASNVKQAEGLALVKEEQRGLQEQYHEEDLAQAATDGTEVVDEYYGAQEDEIYADEPLVTTAAQETAQSVVDTTSSTMSQAAAASIGRNWIQGLINGLKDQALRAQLAAASAELGAIVSSNTKSSLHEKSPSTLAKEDGVNWDLGLINGLKSRMEDVRNAAVMVADQITGTMVRASVISDRLAGTGGNRNVTINQTNNFSGDRYKERDGAAILRSIDLLLGASM